MTRPREWPASAWWILSSTTFAPNAVSDCWADGLLMWSSKSASLASPLCHRALGIRPSGNERTMSPIVAGKSQQDAASLRWPVLWLRSPNGVTVVILDSDKEAYYLNLGARVRNIMFLQQSWKCCLSCLMSDFEISRLRQSWKCVAFHV